MSLFPKKASSTPPKTHGSGEHKAVTTYRDKLKSITEGELEEAKALDAELAKFLAEVSGQPPPRD